MKIRVLIRIFSVSLTLAMGCNAPTGVSESISSTTSSAVATSVARFASGTRTIKVNTSDISGGSFAVPTAIPAVTPVPASYPGYDGSATYKPGVSAVTYYDASGTSTTLKPSWLLDFQLGITDLPGVAGSCATFGTLAGTADVSGFYRTSEINCAAESGGTGSNLTDKAFVRIVLNRDPAVLGLSENLMMQVEYQAAALRLNSDGSNSQPEYNLDQLWKIFWNSSLSGTSAANVFSIFVPPNYAACLSGGSGTTGAAGSNCASGYTGAPITVKQIMIPLSAYPNLSVIQFSRMHGRINNTDTFGGVTPVNYVSSFLGAVGNAGCTADSPLCLGVVIRSIMLMRI